MKLQAETSPPKARQALSMTHILPRDTPPKFCGPPDSVQVICAGYEQEMDSFFDSNPGFKPGAKVLAVFRKM